MIIRPLILRYIPLSLADAAIKLGWLPWLDFGGTHHSAYSAGMFVWLCDCPERWPK